MGFPQQASADAIAAALEEVTAISGVPFGELDPRLRWMDGASSKSAARHVLDEHLPSLRALEQSYGITVRTLPVDAGARVFWPTKIQPIDYVEVARMPFHRSTVRGVLWQVLFSPVRKPDAHQVAQWSLEPAFLWEPQPHELGQLDADYEETRALILQGHPDDLSSAATKGQGRWLMPKTSGRSNRDVVRFEVAGVRMSARRRAFFLRETVTQQLFNLSE